jgi:hypothetical protein
MNKTNTITIAVTIVAVAVLFLVMPVSDVIATTAGGNRQNNDAGNSGGHGTPESQNEGGPGPNDGPKEANCFGKVSAELANSGQTGQHASSFGTPRAGVGNQAEGHPSDHADTIGPIAGSQESCVDR